MKKRILAVILVMTMIFLLTACGVSSDKSAKETKDTGDKVYKIAVMLSNIGDMSYDDAVNGGRIELDTWDNVETTLFEIGLDESKWESYFIDACEGDFDLIVGGFATIEPYLYKVAKEYPDQLFFNYDYSTPEDLDNVYAVTYYLNDLGYVAGYLSALITASDMEYANTDKKVGVIVGEDSDYMNDFIGGFCQVCTEMDTKVYISYTNSYEDPAKAKEQALVMYNEGVDVIWQVAGGSGLGVFEAAADTGKYAIGVDADQTLALEGKPDLQKTIVTSMYKNCGEALIYAVKQLAAGNYPAGKTETLGFKEGTLGVIENDQYLEMVPEDIRTKVNEVVEQMKNGEIKAYSVAAEPDKWPEVKAAATK